MKLVTEDGTSTDTKAGAADALVREGETLFAGPTGPTELDAHEQQQAEQDRQASAAMRAGLGRFVLGGLKAVRSKMAASNRHLLDEWPDAVLKDVADAVPPVVEKRLAALMPMAGKYPEEAALCMALVPMVMGYISATEKRAAALATIVENGDAGQPAAAAGAGADGSAE